MRDERLGQTVVIFLSQRTTQGDAGYGAAADAMEALAATQPGYLGIDSVRRTLSDKIANEFTVGHHGRQQAAAGQGTKI